MANTKPIIVQESDEVKQRLIEIGLTPEIVREIAFEAHSARSDALPIDPSGTAGTSSYQFGVRTTRLNLLPLGWRMDRPGGIEATVNDDLNIQVCFQNVDIACRSQEPKSISDKGPSARELIKSGQFDLFNNTIDESPRLQGKSPTVWLICVSSIDDSFFAEVSCPLNFEGKQFEGFKERIFVIDESDSPELHKKSGDKDDDTIFDVDVPITKK